MIETGFVENSVNMRNSELIVKEPLTDAVVQLKNPYAHPTLRKWPIYIRPHNVIKPYVILPNKARVTKKKVWLHQTNQCACTELQKKKLFIMSFCRKKKKMHSLGT